MGIEDGKSTQEVTRAPRPERAEQSPLQQANAEFWKIRMGSLSDVKDINGGTRANVGVSYDVARKSFGELVSGKSDGFLLNQPGMISEEYGDGMAILLGRLEKGLEFQRLELSHPGALDPDIAARVQREYENGHALFVGASQKLYPDIMPPLSSGDARVMRIDAMRTAEEAAKTLLQDLENAGDSLTHGGAASLSLLRSALAEIPVARVELIKTGTADFGPLISALRSAAANMGSDTEILLTHEQGGKPYDTTGEIQRYRDEFAMRAAKALYTLEIANKPIENAPANTTATPPENRAESSPDQLTSHEKEMQGLLNALVNLEKTDIESSAQAQANTPGTYGASLEAIRTVSGNEKQFLVFLDALMTDLDVEMTNALAGISPEEKAKYPEQGTLNIVATNRALRVVMERLPENIKGALVQARSNDRARQQELSKKWAGTSDRMAMQATTPPEVFVSKLYENFKKARLLNR